MMQLILLLEVAAALVLPSGRPRPALPRRAALRCAADAPAAAEIDLGGDGGVRKTVLRPGTGALAQRGWAVEVHYEGRLLDTGATFDSSRARGKPFKFTLGEGKVIGGWEVGLSSMAVGEMCTLTCTPQYAYGAKGIPPMIPPSATLSFEVELLGATPPAEVQSRTLADDNPDAPRTPQAIQQAYAQKMAAKPAQQEGLAGLLEWAKGIYIFGFFAGDKGERPPWYLNPLITFPAIFAVVGLGFYLGVELGGVHRGTPAPIGDDLRGFLDETPLP